MTFQNVYFWQKTLIILAVYAQRLDTLKKKMLMHSALIKADFFLGQQNIQIWGKLFSNGLFFTNHRNIKAIPFGRFELIPVVYKGWAGTNLEERFKVPTFIDGGGYSLL